MHKHAGIIDRYWLLENKLLGKINKTLKFATNDITWKMIIYFYFYSAFTIAKRHLEKLMKPCRQASCKLILYEKPETAEKLRCTIASWTQMSLFHKNTRLYTPKNTEKTLSCCQVTMTHRSHSFPLGWCAWLLLKGACRYLLPPLKWYNHPT